MTKPPAFQFYVKDWLTGTRRLSLAAKGAYIDLLAWSWDNGPLPLKTREIAQVIGAVASEFARVWKQLVRHWIRTKDGYINSRLELERRKQRAFRKLQAAKGRASAEARRDTGSTVVQPERQPTVNRPGSTGGQPSFALSSALSEDQEPDQDQEQRADARRVLVKLAHGALDAHPGDVIEQKEQIKTEAARARIVYDADLIREALDVAEHQRKNRKAS